MNNQLHLVQANILRELLFNNGASFTSLNKLKLENDHFTFHLKQLVKDGIIERGNRALW